MRLSALLVVSLAAPLSAEEPSLERVLKGGDVPARKRALGGFIPGPADGTQKPLIREALRDRDRGVRQTAAVALAWAGEADGTVVDELVKGMAEPWTPTYARTPDDPFAARQALVKLGGKAVPALIAALEDKKYPAREAAVRTLGEIGTPALAAVPAIEAAIRDRDIPGPHFVIEAKYRIDGDAAFATKRLVPLLDTKEGLNCGGANRVIGRMGRDAKEALPALVAAMRRHKEREVCYDLAALAPHFREQVVAALREALAVPELAASASHALWKAGDPLVVGVDELVENAGKYDGLHLRIEVVLKGFVAQEQWSHAVRAPGGGIEIDGRAKPDARDGDRVAVTGVFRYRPGTFGERVLVEATIEKLAPKKP
jgi:hypothetical protein